MWSGSSLRPRPSWPAEWLRLALEPGNATDPQRTAEMAADLEQVRGSWWILPGGFATDPLAK